MEKKVKWKNYGINHVLHGDGFHISYNPNTNSNPAIKSMNELGGMMGSIIGIDMETDGRSETALCKDGIYYILNGNFTKQYEKLVEKGFDACKKFYDSKAKDYKSNWSTE